MRCRSAPCPECPWVRSTPPGQFPASRYEEIRGTTRDGDDHAGFGAPMFACHMTVEGHEVPCAGWLAAVGEQSVTVRLNVAYGEIPADALRPGDDWPELFDDYDEMVEAQGATR